MKKCDITLKIVGKVINVSNALRPLVEDPLVESLQLSSVEYDHPEEGDLYEASIIVHKSIREVLVWDNFLDIVSHERVIEFSAKEIS